MRKVTFFVGQGFSGDGVEIDSPDLASMQALAWQYLNAEFGGFTALLGVGGWQGYTPPRSVVEPTMPIIVITDYSDRLIENAAKFLRETFKQNSVLYNVEAAPEARMI